MIPEGHQKNLNTIVRAAKNGHLVLIECTDVKTGQPVFTLGAYDGQALIPLAKMFDSNPYEELIPPSL